MIKDILKRPEAKQFIKFLFVGGSAFLIDFSINILIVRILDMDIKTESLIANIISYSIALIYNYTMSSRWSFKEDGKDPNRDTNTMIRFIGVNLFNLAWSSLAIWALVGIIRDSNIISNQEYIQPITKFLVTSLNVLVSFVLYKIFVFKN